MAAIIARVGPCTLEPESQGFVTLVDSIVSQQISVKAANAIMARITALVGEVTPEQLLRRTPEELRAVGLSNQKARYVLDLAAHVADGRIDLAAFPQCDDDTIVAQLTAVKGIGRWTSEIYLIFALGRLDVLPADDLGLQQAAQQAFGLDHVPKSVELRLIGESWRPYRTIASWYLWRSRRMV
ncbi:DNA-3-methyladenine glycosylase 2 family protein [Candidatus Gracilibacteria bacterium]|nr:DNA-3-methyladenine glycosylase 2 family protein [Candidatus Gracilibacteria bacterium]